MRIRLANFLVPDKPRVTHKVSRPNVSAVVPTYKPGATAFRLAEDLLRYNPGLTVVVVDDSTPLEDASMDVFERLRALGPRVTVLRTPQNRLKAGALNLALDNLLRKGAEAPAVILTLDDDVTIAPDTVERMVHALLANPKLGAVCSRCSVANKNKNLLTRLQGLEYVGFNAIRLGDQGFVRGPLVMHGMLTAFRARALREAGPFAERHLIEDYEMTTRIKTLGWDVQAVLGAEASTEVPETWGKFWRQRTRWSYGGVEVVVGARDWSAVIQDVLGHVAFILTLGVIVILLTVDGGGTVPSMVVKVIVALSLLQLAAWFGYQLWLMRWYKEKDGWDWALRLTLIPELLFSSIMTLVLLGSYLFLGFTALARVLSRQGRLGERVVRAGSRLFAKLGYSSKWGTR